MLQRFAALAAELAVVLPISYFERANNAHFNSIAVFDADGTLLGNYRKSHIPDGPGYQEKVQLQKKSWDNGTTCKYRSVLL